MREDLYPEPHEFHPERFLEQDPGRYTWIAFGGGIRHCIGRTLATHEARYVLRTLVQKFRFTAAVQGDEGVRRRGILWIPKEGCRVVLTAGPGSE